MSLLRRHRFCNFDWPWQQPSAHGCFDATLTAIAPENRLSSRLTNRCMLTMSNMTAQPDRFSQILHECPFVFIRSDSIRILWDHHYPNEKLVVNAAAVLKHDPSLVIVKTPEGGQKTPLAVIEVVEKVKFLQKSPPESILDRVKYLGSPSNYLFEHFYFLYTRVYGSISESVLRKYLAQVCHADIHAIKFALPKDLWTCNVKWPDWCHGGAANGPSSRSVSPANEDNGDDFIEIPDDWERVLRGRGERQLRTLSSPYTRSVSPDRRPSHSKRARRELDDRLGEIALDWDGGHDQMDIDDERAASDHTDSRPSTPTNGDGVASIDLMTKMTARRVLNAILERGSANGASGLNRSDQIDPSKDRTRSVNKRAKRLAAQDFFSSRSSGSTSKSASKSSK